MKRCRERIRIIKKCVSMKACFAAVMAAVMLLTACQSSPVETPPEKIRLNLWYYWDASTARQRLLTLINEFNDMHNGIEIVAKCVPDEDFKKTLALAIADGTMPDLAIVDSADVRYYQNMENLADVSACVDEAAYLKQALASCLLDDGSIIGLPMGVNLLSFYYNKDILERRHLKPPTTLEEFVQVANHVTTDTVYGCAFPSLQSEESTFCFLPILWGHGGDLDNINSAEGKKAFDVLRRLSREGSMSHSTANMTISDILKEFAKGNLAMMFATSCQEPQISQANPKLNFEVSRLPMGDVPVTVLGGEVLTVMSQDQQGEAMEFVRFMAEPERMKTYLKDMGYLAPRKDVLEWQVQENPEQRKYISYLQSAQLREFTPYWPTVSLAVADVVNQVILQEDEPDELDKLAEKIRRIREEYHDRR